MENAPQCPKKHVGCLNRYCGEAINPTFLLLKFCNRQDTQSLAPSLSKSYKW